MKVLVIGSGGREHTLTWKIAQSEKVKKIYCAPGNAGTVQLGENVPIPATDIPALADFAEKEAIDLTVVGPEDPLVKGISTKFKKRNLKIFGPSAEAAEIEGSKAFAKNLMNKYKIPTAKFEIFDSADNAIDYAKSLNSPLVVKADGLAAGKGVLMCKTPQCAEDALNKVMIDRKFGESGSKVVVEEWLQGEEASILAFADGKDYVPMVSSQDHKRALDGDKGLNTGGMGAYSPAPIITVEMQQEINEKILEPTVKAMRGEERNFSGILYAGLMITKEGPKVIEFNARFGDPETQVILPRLESDLVEIFEHCIDGTLLNADINWTKKAATCVVMAAGGYPELYSKGNPINGLEEAANVQDAVVFHAGTSLQDGKVVTSGGRVLGVTGLGHSVKESIDRAYEAVSKIHFENAHYRKDIGSRALNR